MPFLVLDENRFAYAAVEGLFETAVGRGRLVLVHGPTGTGKSHLAQLLSREIARRASALPIVCNGSDLTVRDDVSSSLLATVEEPPKDDGARRFLVCEDLQAVARQAAAQESLVRIMDTCRVNGVDVLLTSNRSPGDIAGLSARLRSRLRSGVCAGIGTPNSVSREKLIQHFCSHMQLPMTGPAIRLFVKHLPVSPRELLGAARRFDEMAHMHRKSLDGQFAQVFLQHEVLPAVITIDAVAKAVSREFGVRLGDVRSSARDQLLRTARQCAMFLARELTSGKYVAIGEYFGNRSHSTVLHACNRIQESLGEDALLRQRISSVKQALGSQ